MTQSSKWDQEEKEHLWNGIHLSFISTYRKNNITRDLLSENKPRWDASLFY